MHTHLLRCGRAWTFAALVAALLLVAGASGGVNTPQSGWYSGNPTLGPSNLTDLVCAGSTCYAAGGFGTLLRSTDSGSSWSGVVTGLTLDLRRVRVAGSAETIVVGGGCSLRRSDDGGTTFERLPFTASDDRCPAALSAFSFPSSNVGYLVLAPNAVLSTADGGRTFTRRTAVPSGPVHDLLCTGEQTCFAAAADGQVLRTPDGGISWTVEHRGSFQLNGLEQADARTLYAVGQQLALFKSQDGGESWTPRPISGVPPADLVSIRCADVDTCLIATRDPSRVITTDDGGATFTSTVVPAGSANAVEMPSKTRGVAVGNVGTAIVSDDAGESWRIVGGRLVDRFRLLEAASDTVAYAGGVGGALARTVDAGQTWSNVSPPSSVDVRSVAAPTPNRLFVLAADGTLQRSDNGGSSYRLLNTGTPFGAQEVTAADAEHVLLVGLRGLRRSVNGGETFSAVSDRDLRNARLFGGDTAGSAMFAYGARRLLYSPNGGLSWRRLPLPKTAFVVDVSFVSARFGYVLDRRGRLWRTGSAGRKWVELRTLGRLGIEVDFADARNGYVAIAGFGRRENGHVLRTSDGGASWRPQLVSPAPVSQVDMAGSTAYLLARESFLYATRSGGDVGAPRSLRLTTRGRTLARPSTVTVSGRLSAAVAGEVAVVSRHADGQWTTQVATVASNGTFTTRWRVESRSLFVAHVLASADHSSAGTRPLSVDIRKKKVKRRR